MSKVAYDSVVEKNKVEIISDEKEILFGEDGNLILWYAKITLRFCKIC